MAAADRQECVCVSQLCIGLRGGRGGGGGGRRRRRWEEEEEEAGGGCRLTAPHTWLRSHSTLVVT